MVAQRGFTLLELMTAFAVVAIIVTMAMPSFSNLMAKQGLNSSIRELAGTLSLARAQAVMLRREVTVTLNSSSPSTQTTFFWTPSSTKDSLTSSTTSVVFRVDGTVKDATADQDFTVCNSKLGRSKTITLTRTGTQYTKSEGVCT